MPHIEHGGQRIPLGPADLTIGAFDGATVRLPGSDPSARAVLSVGPDGRGVVRRGAPEAVVLVNNVRLGVEPSPLMHGDKLELAGVVVAYGDDHQAGSTQFVSASEMAEVVRAARASAARRRPTMATGGRVVSLVDGREYLVGEAGVSFGREVGNEIVIASNDVSRRHATISPAEHGYILTDASTNGLFVNGERVAHSVLLARADVIKIGPEEFRFYADVAPAAPPTPAPASEPAPDPAPAATAAPARQALATLVIINEGPMKGTQFALRAALTNIGRGEHNDVSVLDESVSDSHAKILKRNDAWWLVDQGSTNGTYLAGRRIQGEVELVGAPDVRFGGVKMTFRPAVDPAAAEAKGTRAVTALSVDAAKRLAKAAPRATATTPAPQTAPPTAGKKSGCAALFILLVSSAAVAVSSGAAFVLAVLR